MIKPVNYKPKQTTRTRVMEEVYNNFREKNRELAHRDFFLVPEKDFRDYLEMKKVIVNMAKCMQDKIPNASYLHQIIERWANEV